MLVPANEFSEVLARNEFRHPSPLSVTEQPGGDLHIELVLDRPDARAAAASDPGFIVSGPGPVLIDEFQHVPEILDAIKAELNTDTRPGRYVLTGSTRYSVSVSRSYPLVICVSGNAKIGRI